MVKHAFTHVETWVFDLDNTLYPPRYRLFDQIEVKMTDWVMEALQVGRTEANRLRHHYWQTYGTTLSGLMREHGIAPGPYLNHVHDIDFTVLPPDPALATAITALPGRKIIYTNGGADYAVQVLTARGLNGLFDAIYGIEEAGFLPKPERGAYDVIFARDGLDPARAAMFEDDPRNLRSPHDMGLRTVLVAEKPVAARHIHHHTNDLTAFLTALTL